MEKDKDMGSPVIGHVSPAPGEAERRETQDTAPMLMKPPRGKLVVEGRTMDRVYIVIELSGDDLYSTEFHTFVEAVDYIESHEYKAYLIKVEPGEDGNVLVGVEPHT